MGIAVQASLVMKQDPISKITKAERAGGVTQVVEHLLSKCDALSSNPNTPFPCPPQNHQN
jgi:hypothetical protein